MKKIVTILFCVIFFIPVFAQEMDNRISFNKNWKFSLVQENSENDLQQGTENFYKVDFDDIKWRTLDIPHDWSIEQKFSKDNAHQNAWLPGGIGWYRKDFILKKEDEKKHIEIQFDGIFRHAEIWINGKYVGVQYDGYTSFYYDISSYLKFDAVNKIAIRIDNSVQPNCRWYSGSGIFRNVWLRTTDPMHVKNWGTAITTPVITSSEAKVLIQTELENTRIGWKNCILETSIVDENGIEIIKKEEKVVLGSKLNVTIKQEFSVYSPKLWSLNTPVLYTAISRIKEKGKLIDEYKSTFGIRDIKFDAKTGFYLNGENLKFKGVALHSAAGVFGAAVPVEVWERRLIKLKETGCNAIRTAHNPMAPEFMDLCDRLGFLVMDEFVDKWDDETFANPFFHNEWPKNFGQTVRRDRNHPSVVIWSVGNENHNPGTVEQTESLKRYCNFVRTIDSSRPVVSGMQRSQGGDPEEIVKGVIESTSHMDLIAMNYGEQWCERIAHLNPGKPFISTESYTYFGSTEDERWAFIERAPWMDVIKNDHNMGLFLWSGIKYLGEIAKKGKNSWPNVYCSPEALLNSAGFRTPMSYFYESLWSAKPMIYTGVLVKDTDYNKKWGAPPITESWNFKNKEEVDLVTYTNCETVELYVNNKKIGTQKLSDCANHLMRWRNISYQSGTLKVIGFNAGKKVCEYELHTAKNPTKLQIVADKNNVSKADVVQVEIQLLDKDENFVKHKEIELKFDIEGGHIIGLDNGGLNALDYFKAIDKRNTHLGKCLATIRVGNETGELKLNVSGKSINRNSIVIKILK